MRSRLPIAPFVLLLLLLGQLLAYGDYFTDDSYIYARFATNLVERGEFAFNPGEHVHAATSPLWALLVAILVLTGVTVVAGTKVIGASCAGAALVLAWRIGERRLGAGSWCAVLVLLLATEPWFVRWSASGMETPLAVLLLMVALEAGLRPVREVAWARVGWALGLMPLVRPEALMLAGFVGLLALVTPDARRNWKLWCGLILPMAIWSAFSWSYYGAILPETLQAKSTPLGFVPSRLFGNLVTLGALFVVALALPSVAWVLSILRAPGRALRRDEADWMRPSIVAWTVALPVVYLARDVQVVSRYLEIVLPAVLVLGVTEMARWKWRRAWTSLAVVEAAVVLALTLAWIVPSANEFGRGLAGMVEMGEWLHENSAPDDVVAAYDIGAVGWASDRPVLDLGGLVHPGINDLRNRIDDREILHDALFLDYGDPAFLVDRDPDGAVLDGRILRDRRCDKVLERRVENLGLTRPAPVVYTLYRLVPATD